MTERPDRAARGGRFAALLCSLLLLAGGATACTRTIDGTPGPAPTVGGGGGDFPSTDSSDTPTDDSTDAPTDDSTDEPTDDSTQEPTSPPSEDGSIQELCADMADTISGPDLGSADAYQALIGLDILGWGLGNGDSDPFSTVDAKTTAACPDTRTAVLAKTGTPDLKTIGN